MGLFDKIKAKAGEVARNEWNRQSARQRETLAYRQILEKKAQQARRQAYEKGYMEAQRKAAYAKGQMTGNNTNRFSGPPGSFGMQQRKREFE